MSLSTELVQDEKSNTNSSLLPRAGKSHSKYAQRCSPHQNGPACYNRKDVTLRKGLSVLLPPSAFGNEFSAEWRTKKETQHWLLGVSDRIELKSSASNPEPGSLTNKFAVKALRGLRQHALAKLEPRSRNLCVASTNHE